MARLIWTETALQDLDAIAEYIAFDNHAAAKALVQTVLQSVERLKAFPESGRIPPELPNTPYREIICPPCRIFYRIEKSRIYIVHVLRSERELRDYLLETRGQS